MSKSQTGNAIGSQDEYQLSIAGPSLQRCRLLPLDAITAITFAHVRVKI